MVTDKVIRWGNNSYYMAPDGKMAINQTVPDGRNAGDDGILTGKMNSEYFEQAATDGEMDEDYSREF